MEPKLPNKKDPLHGVTLEVIVNHFVNTYGWKELGQRITINCFIHDQSISSSLKFLRKMPWARKKVEDFYLYTLRQDRKIQNHPNGK